MKSIVKYLYLFIFLSISLQAQEKFGIGFSTGPSLLNDNLALCSRVNLLFNFTNRFNAVLDFEHLICKVRKREIELIPKLRYKTNLFKFNPYFEFGLGISHYPKVRETLKNGSFQGSGEIGETTLGIGGYSESFELGTGLIIPINKKLNFDLSLSISQTAFSNFSCLGFGLLYWI